MSKSRKIASKLVQRCPADPVNSMASAAARLGRSVPSAAWSHLWDSVVLQRQQRLEGTGTSWHPMGLGEGVGDGWGLVVPMGFPIGFPMGLPIGFPMGSMVQGSPMIQGMVPDPPRNLELAC